MDDQADYTRTLAPEVIETIARRVVEALRHEAPARIELVDAAELARRLGIERSWVYTHAIELGAIRLGDGRRPRLRFDPHLAIERMRARAERDAAQAPGRRVMRKRPGNGADRPRLLPINGSGAS